MRKYRTDRAFTLVELLIVSVILSVISLVIYASFANGMKIWKRVNGGVQGEEYVLFFERFGGEVRAALRMKEPRFLGSDSSIEFPVVSYSRRMATRVVSRVRYSFDHENAAVTRSLEDYSALFTGKPPESKALLSGVAQLRFSYYRFDPESKRFVWLEDWPFETLPLAVRMEIQRKGAGEQDKIVRTFPVPGGNIKDE